jgi:hypothetical protein
MGDGQVGGADGDRAGALLVSGQVGQGGGAGAGGDGGPAEGVVAGAGDGAGAGVLGDLLIAQYRVLEDGSVVSSRLLPASWT